jgi:hypothetical protein
MTVSRSIVLVFMLTLGVGASAPAPLKGRPTPSAQAAVIDEGAWHSLPVTGGRAALDSLGVASTLDRATTMTELIRRLHFSANAAVELEAAALNLKVAVANLRTLQGAIAQATSGGKAPSLALASQRDGRKRLEDALAAAGLELREQRQQFTIAIGDGERAKGVRDRLAMLGLNVEALHPQLARGGEFTIAMPTLELPLPLSRDTWNRTIFEREVAPDELFAEILTDPGARLLYHGLAGLDAETRRWIATQKDLLHRLYQDEQAARTFAVFGAAVRIAGGKVVVPGGQVAARRWRGLLGVNVEAPDRFVRRLFEMENGRIAGLYFTVAAVEEPRQRFILDMVDRPQDLDARIKRLATSFANCYPEATTYPLRLRSHDAAVLLAEVGLTPIGNLAGPASPKFWSRALSGDSLPDNPAGELRGFADEGPIDGAWMVEALCGASQLDRGAVFSAFLFGHRAFVNIPAADVPDALVAVRARRLYPAVMTAVEQAGVKTSRTFAAVARHAERIGSVGDPAKAITAAQQFQGALLMTVGAIVSQTLPIEAGARLMESLAAQPFDDGQYQGQLARWFADQWLPAVRQHLKPAVAASATTVERLVVEALSGPPAEGGRVISWEGQQYLLDFAGTTRARLLAVRKRQGGVTLDSIVALERVRTQLQQAGVGLERVGQLRSELLALAPQLVLPKVADEFGSDAPGVVERTNRVLRDLTGIDEADELTRAGKAAQDLGEVIDFLFGHVLASWAYAPHVGEADGPMMVGGDPSLRHEFGLRLPVPARTRRRWELPPTRGFEGAVSGALIGLEASLAPWSLRRLASDTVPQVPTIVGNDLWSFFLTAALSNPRRLTDEDRDDIARAYRAGSEAIERAGRDRAALDAVAAAGALSPWTREGFSWMVSNEPDRIAERFSAIERIRIGGLRSVGVDEWGTASLLSGCLCIKMPMARVPELVIGRAADGLIASQTADPMLRLAVILAELNLPAPLASPVMAYAMRDFLDHVKPSHAADFEAFVRQARAIDRRTVEDYLGAIAAVGPLRRAPEKP